MDRGIYSSILNSFKTLISDFPHWYQDNKGSLIKDYFFDANIYDQKMALIKIGAKVYEKILVTTPKSLAQDDVIQLILSLNSPEDGVYLSAYYFVIKLTCDALNIPTDIDISSLREDLIPYILDEKDEEIDVTSSTSILNYYKNKLLDLSRGNPLVHYKPLLTSVSFLHPNLENLITLLKKNEKVYIESWESLNAHIVYECSSCHKQFLVPYDRNSSSHALPCPDCDQNKKTKQCRPIKEDPLFLPISLSCSSCQEINQIDELNLSLSCQKCGKDLHIKNSPLLDEKILKKPTPYIISYHNDIRTMKSIESLKKYNDTLEFNFGLHPLYIALGFLNWTSRNGQEYHSPILLCRVNVGIDRSKGKAYISLDDTNGDEPISINYTLKKMLASYSKTYSITLPELLSDEPINEYLLRLSMNLNSFSVSKNFKIEQSAILGKFYYHKLQLEKDFEDHFDLYLNHPIIQNITHIEDHYTEELISEENSQEYLVLDADSSQQKVIDLMRSNKSFVLQGPPGTGKSQTITNIITDAIGHKKSVLFVTEKESARNIIFKNLSEIKIDQNHSLNEFVLNIDSKNFTKKKFQQKYNSSFASFDTVNIASTKENLLDVTKRLQSYYDFSDDQKLHDLTIHELIGKWSSFSNKQTNNVGRKDENFFNVKDVTKIKPYEIDNFISNYYAYEIANKVSHTDLNPIFQGYMDNSLTLPSLDIMERFRNHLFEGKPMKLQIEQIINRSIFELYLGDFDRYIQFFDAFSTFPKLSYDTFRALYNNRSYMELENFFIEHKNRLVSIYNKIQDMNANPYNNVEELFNIENLLNLDVNESNNLLDNYKSFLSRFDKKYAELKEKIESVYKIKPDNLKYQDYKELLRKIPYYIDAYNQKEECLKKLEEVKNYYHFALQNDDLPIKEMIDDYEKTIQIIQTCKSTNVYIRCLLLRLDKASRYETFIDELKTWTKYFKEQKENLSKDIEDLKPYFDSKYFDLSKMKLNDIKEKICSILNNRSKVSNYIQLKFYLESIKDNEILMNLSKKIAKNGYSKEDAYNAIMKSYYSTCVMYLLDSDSTIRHFLTRGGSLNDIEKYCSLDELRLKENAYALYNQLSLYKKEAYEDFIKLYPNEKLIPTINKVSLKSIMKDRFEQIKHITPCIMMSPLNVSQFLDISCNFDMVIFDEASQIFLEEALASIVRGKQIIISGDDKQLPPFDFGRSGDIYSSSDEYEEEDFTLEDESILDGAIHSSLSSEVASLKWHYRSEEESLIDFSNKHFYDNNLITFPASKHDSRHGIFYHFVEDGTYLSAGLKINKEEAIKVIQTLYNEITSLDRIDFTIGVVAFNKVQAEYIESEWNKFLNSHANDERIQMWKEHNAKKNEPIIFCNLDTIQGDERDTIILSTTYGANKEDVFSLSYLGPLRNLNGQKRINVAISRARKRMIVLTSLKIDVLENALIQSQGKNEGAKVLLDFLKYAKSFSTSYKKYEDNEISEFGKSICSLLDKNNIHYDVNVGLSTYKVQIGIKKEANDSNYVLGIIIDEDGLKHQTLRDFIRLKDQILTRKYAWKLYHIFLLPWFYDYKNEVQKLFNVINECLRSSI